MQTPCMYCRYHKRTMTVRQMKRKSCLSKKNTGHRCKHLKKIGHPYWNIKAQIKKDKKRKKEG